MCKPLTPSFTQSGKKRGKYFAPSSNGSSNGYSNGSSNGYSNGSSNGYSNGSSNGSYRSVFFFFKSETHCTILGTASCTGILSTRAQVWKIRAKFQVCRSVNYDFNRVIFRKCPQLLNGIPKRLLHHIPHTSVNRYLKRVCEITFLSS